jgi:hypothetical protein
MPRLNPAMGRHPKPFTQPDQGQQCHRLSGTKRVKAGQMWALHLAWQVRGLARIVHGGSNPSVAARGGGLHPRPPALPGSLSSERAKAQSVSNQILNPDAAE